MATTSEEAEDELEKHPEPKLPDLDALEALLGRLLQQTEQNIIAALQSGHDWHDRHEGLTKSLKPERDSLSHGRGFQAHDSLNGASLPGITNRRIVRLEKSYSGLSAGLEGAGGRGHSIRSSNRSSGRRFSGGEEGRTTGHANLGHHHHHHHLNEGSQSPSSSNKGDSPTGHVSMTPSIASAAMLSAAGVGGTSTPTAGMTSVTTANGTSASGGVVRPIREVNLTWALQDANSNSPTTATSAAAASEAIAATTAASATTGSALGDADGSQQFVVAPEVPGSTGDIIQAAAKEIQDMSSAAAPGPASASASPRARGRSRGVSVDSADNFKPDLSSNRKKFRGRRIHREDSTTSGASWAIAETFSRGSDMVRRSTEFLRVRASAVRGVSFYAQHPPLETLSQREAGLKHAHRSFCSEANGPMDSLWSDRAPSTPWGRLVTGCRQIVATKFFQLSISAAIVLNVILIGWQADWSVKHPTSTSIPVFRVFDLVFASIFVFELGLRIIADGIKAFSASNKNHMWNRFDALLVVMIVAEEGLKAAATTTVEISAMRTVRVFRFFRILRVVKVARLFSDLRIMVSGIGSSLRSLFWAIVLLFILSFMFGVVILDFVGQKLSEIHLLDASDQGQYAELESLLLQYWGSLDITVYMLYQAICGGVDWGNVAEPLLEISPFLSLIFCIYIAIALFCVFNVITGVFVENTTAMLNKDETHLVMETLESRKRWIEEVRNLWDSFSNDGHVDCVTFTNKIQDVRIQALFRRLGVEVEAEKAEGLFQLLDLTGTGLITKDHLAMGIQMFHGQAKNIDMARLRAAVDMIMEKLTEMETRLARQGSAVDEVLDYLGEVPAVPSRPLSRVQSKTLSVATGTRSFRDEGGRFVVTPSCAPLRPAPSSHTPPKPPSIPPSLLPNAPSTAEMETVASHDSSPSCE